MFDPTYAATVLLPLSDAAYCLPLKVGVVPAEYDFVGPIKIDGSSVEWAINRIKPSRRIRLRTILDQKQFGWVCYSKNTQTIVVAFRGTDDIYDILRDFEFEAEPYDFVPNYGMVHVGFQHVYMAIRDSVIELVKSLPLAKRCILTGHSLGGALSQLAAPDLYYQHILSSVPEVVNFASPRVGHQDFVDKFNVDITSCYRIVNKWDIIPTVPPMHNGYAHTGTEIAIDGGKTLIVLHAHCLETSYINGMIAYLKKLVTS